MSSYGVVTTITAPSLEGITQPVLIKFEVEYAAYKDKVDDVNRTREGMNKIATASIKQCMKPELLHSLAILGEIEGATTVEEATEEKVRNWFDSRMAAAPKDIAERVRSAVDSVTYKQCSADPGGAAMEFVLNVVTALDKNNASDIVQNDEKCKSLMGRLINKLEPPELRIRIGDERAFWSAEERSKLSHFMKRASAIAIEVHNGEVARAKLKKRPLPPRSDDQEKPKNNFNVSSSKSKKKQKRDNKPTEQKEGSKPSKKWNKVCLNEECKGIHPIKDCPNTSPEKRKQLLDAYFEAKKSMKTMRVQKTTENLPESDSGRYKVLIEDKVEAVALGDYGADFTALDKKTMESVRSAIPDLELVHLQNPINLRAAVNGTKESPLDFTASTEIRVSLTIVIPGSNLPVRIRGVKCIVVDQDMDEVLLGRPFLQAIGFNLDNHLKRVGEAINGKMLEEISDGNLSSVKYQGLQYGQTDGDPIKLDDAFSAGIGEQSTEELNDALEKLIKESIENGLSKSGEDRLRSLLTQYREVFRIRLCNDPTAKVPPLSVKMFDNARPFRCSQRRYAPVQRSFICQTIKELEKVGAVHKNPFAKWASPALAVPKPGSTKLRFTVDLRGVNAKTSPIQSSMPHLESKFQECEGNSLFCKIDFCHGYWQMPLAKDSQEIFSIQTPLGVYSPTRILQGGTDSGNHFQAMTQQKFDERIPKMIQWMDDFLLYARNENELLDSVEKFFKVCNECNFKIHAQKCEIMLSEVNFCGRKISVNGIQHDPRNFEALTRMKNPVTAADLQQFLCALNWMRTSLPNYAATVEPLHNLMEEIYKSVGKRTRKAVQKVKLGQLWGNEHDMAYKNLKSQLTSLTKLAYPKPGHSMCLFTDASETHWAAVLTQVPDSQRREEIDKQDHQPICFLSGAFKGASYNWSVPEKEGFAVVEAMCRLDYLITGHQVSIYTDHSNLVYIYDPYGKNPGVSRHTANKLMRWALKLSEFRYVIEYMPGSRNVWADMLTRWAVKTPNNLTADKSHSAKSLVQAPIDPGIHSEFDWPDKKDIALSQNKHSKGVPKNFTIKDGVSQNAIGIWWIPSEDEELKLRLLIAAHSGKSGHRSSKTTLMTIASHFWWNNMNRDCQSFVASCLHCLCSEPGNSIPRPLGHALHATKPNELIHFDYCFIGKSENQMKYVLVIKDDFSSYVWLIPCDETTADKTAEELMRWFAAFGVVKSWLSDRGSHFYNELVKSLRDRLKAAHHFTLAYCPWSNGTVEVVCRELLRASRALSSEFKIPSEAWPAVMPLVQSALNNSPIARLGNRCPLTAFTGLPQDTPLSTIKHQYDGVEILHTIDELKLRRILNIKDTQAALESMHRDVQEKTTKKRQAAVDSHNRKTGVRPINFGKGDFVLRGLLRREVGRKLSLRWKGPYRVVDCKDNYIFKIEDLLSRKVSEAHGRRLKFFRNSSLDVSEDLTEHLEYQQGELLVIDELQDIRERDGKVEVEVKWRGFTNEESDWVELDSLKQDVPELLQEYLEETSKDGTVRQRRLISKL